MPTFAAVNWLLPIYHLFRKELIQERRQLNATWVIILYVLSSVFVAYLSFKRILSLNTWIALYWLIVIFGTFNATLRVFDKENEGRDLLLAQLLNPQQVVIAKSLFATLLALLVGLVCFFASFLLLGLPVENLELQHYLWFLLLLLLAAVGLGFLLVLINGIAFKSGNNLGMATILGMPLALPLLLLLIRNATLMLNAQPVLVFQKYLLSLTGLDALLVVLSCTLFPYLWRD